MKQPALGRKWGKLSLHVCIRGGPTTRSRASNWNFAHTFSILRPFCQTLLKNCFWSYLCRKEGPVEEYCGESSAGFSGGEGVGVTAECFHSILLLYQQSLGGQYDAIHLFFIPFTWQLYGIDLLEMTGCFQLMNGRGKANGAVDDETFKKFLFNKDKGTCLGRTAKSWG